MQKHDLTCLQTIIESFEKMGKKKKIEKTQKYFMIVWARAQFLKFLRSRSRVWKKMRSRSRLQPDERALRARLKWAALTKALLQASFLGPFLK